jgi:hypothetical protein
MNNMRICDMAGLYIHVRVVQQESVPWTLLQAIKSRLLYCPAQATDTRLNIHIDAIKHRTSLNAVNL